MFMNWRKLCEILANQLHYVICTLTMLEQRRRVAEFCRKHNIRAVFLGAGAVGMGFPTFAVDTRDEMHRLVNRFHELGHRKIALLCGQHRHCATEFRHQGYLDALAEHEIDEKMTFCQEFSTEPFLNFIEQERPTALACIDGMVATLALNALLRHGVNVPGEISILGDYRGGNASVHSENRVFHGTAGSRNDQCTGISSDRKMLCPINRK